ncbi:MAG TPA: FRG domain-containing protein, partial [Cyclobacteriaceae bacterium]|nr:FRG domain-containing protein [Cyclobacteriaceae bacterium]
LKTRPLMATVENGILKTKVDSWNELSTFTRYFSDDLGFIFRGQADSAWKLETSLNRFLNKTDPKLKNNTVYDFHLRNFRESIRGRGVKTTGLSDNELWALGQHYGLFTPLLDWSFSFHISLYFAFIEEIKPVNGYRTIFALHRQGVTDRVKEYNKEKTEHDKFDIVESMSDENPRIINQAGLFTKIPLDFNLQHWVHDQFKGMTKGYFFIIEINDKERMRILKELNLMNINPKTVFPDLHGSSMNCNHKLMLNADKAVNTLKI